MLKNWDTVTDGGLIATEKPPRCFPYINILRNGIYYADLSFRNSASMIRLDSIDGKDSVAPDT